MSNAAVGTLPLMVRLSFPALLPFFFWLRVVHKMQNRTGTLEIGSRAPEFSLSAVNREGQFTLSGLIEQGTLILEFLRGTW